jgi:hypothetical protein
MIAVEQGNAFNYARKTTLDTESKGAGLKNEIATL